MTEHNHCDHCAQGYVMHPRPCAIDGCDGTIVRNTADLKRRYFPSLLNEPEPDSLDAALHPNGRCTCCGEGQCEWCQQAMGAGGSSLADALTEMVEAVQAVDALTPECRCGHGISHKADSTCPPSVVGEVISKMTWAAGFNEDRRKTKAISESLVLIDRLRDAPGWHWRFDPENGASVSWELHRRISTSSVGVGYIRCSSLGWEVVDGQHPNYGSAKSPEEATDAFRERMVEMCGGKITDAEADRLIAEVAGRIAQWRETK